MASLLSATAPVFLPSPQFFSSNTSELVADVVIRKNEDIGEYRDGVLRPHKSATSSVTWRQQTPLTEGQPMAVLEPRDESLPTDFAALLAGTGLLVEILGTKAPDSSAEAPLVGYDTIDVQSTAFHHHRDPPTFRYDMAGVTSTDQYTQQPRPYYPEQAIYQSTIVPASDIRGPKWEPTYHKAISPSIERANRVVEEFKVYFGDGRSPNILAQLQKICFLCGLGARQGPPETVDGCFALLRNTYINVFDLVEAGRAEQQGWPEGGSWIFPIPTFRSSRQFFDYCKEQGKVCPRWIGKANPLFQDVMNRFR